MNPITHEGTPPELIKKPEAAMQAASSRAEVKDRLLAAVGEAAYLNTVDVSAFLRTDTPMWERITKTLIK